MWIGSGPDWHGAGVFPCAATADSILTRACQSAFFEGRRFLTDTKKKFDVIHRDVPTRRRQLNRFYTVEFFLAARAHLARAGAGRWSLRSSEETISRIWRLFG